MSRLVNKVLFALIAGLALIAVAACAPTPQNVAIAQAGGNTPATPQQFHLGPGDHVHVTVFGADQISGEYAVDISGNVAIPLAGTIPAQGLTSAELGARIADRLREAHLVDNAQVSIEIVSTRPIYILGEVEKPGEYPFHAGLNVVSAVATAGGFKYRADQDHVFIRRGGQGNEVEVPFASAAPVYPGDIVRIPSRDFF